MAAQEENEYKGLTYKGKPLIRKGNLMYYGDPTDKYIVMLQIHDTKEENDIEMASKVSVTLQLTDETLRARDKVVRKTDKTGLYEALDVGAVWLERALAERL